jgi:hypothetical protein
LMVTRREPCVKREAAQMQESVAPDTTARPSSNVARDARPLPLHLCLRRPRPFGSRNVRVHTAWHARAIHHVCDRITPPAVGENLRAMT